MPVASIIYLKNRTNGRTYAYLNESQWDSVTKKCRCKRKCLGHVDPVTGDIVPNRKKAEPPNTVTVENFGLRLFFDSLTTDMGLMDAVHSTFPDRWRIIMSMVYFILDSHKNLSRIRRWSMENETPYGKQIDLNDIDMALRNITENDLYRFFGTWRERFGKDEFYFEHICSRSDLQFRSDSNFEIMDDDDTYKMETNVSVIFSEKTSLPVAFSVWDRHPRSLTDLDIRKNEKLWMDIGEPLHVLDTDFCITGNIDSLLQRMKPFILKMTHNDLLTSELISNVGDKIMNLENRINVNGEDLFSMTFLRFIGGHKCFVHIFYSTKRAESEFSSFLGLVEKCQKELEHRRLVPNHMKFYEEYFIVTDEGEHRYVEKNGDAIMNYSRICGFTVIISNTVRNSNDAYGKYIELNKLHAHYENLMNEEDRNNLKLYNTANFVGRVFVQFLASIVYREFRNRTESSKVIRNLPFWNVMYEIKNVHRVRVHATNSNYNTNLNDYQRELMRLLNISRGTDKM